MFGRRENSRENSLLSNHGDDVSEEISQAARAASESSLLEAAPLATTCKEYQGTQNLWDRYNNKKKKGERNFSAPHQVSASSAAKLTELSVSLVAQRPGCS